MCMCVCWRGEGGSSTKNIILQCLADVGVNSRARSKIGQKVLQSFSSLPFSVPKGQKLLPFFSLPPFLRSQKEHASCWRGVSCHQAACPTRWAAGQGPFERSGKEGDVQHPLRGECDGGAVQRVQPGPGAVRRWDHRALHHRAGHLHPPWAHLGHPYAAQHAAVCVQVRQRSVCPGGALCFQVV